MVTVKTSSLSELRRLFPYFRRYRSRIVWGLIFITISNICSSTIPHIVGMTVDTIQESRYSENDIWLLIARILLLTIGSGLGMFATRRTIIVMSRFVEEDLRNDFLAAIQVQAQNFYHDRSTGSLLAHFTNDIASVREFIGPAIMYSANTITTFLFVLSWMISINGLLTAAILVPVPFVAWTTYTLGKKIHDRYRSVQEQYEHVTMQSQETFSGVRVVRAYAREFNEGDRFSEISKVYYTRNMMLARIQSLMMPGMTVLFNLSYIVVISVGGYLVMKDRLSVGQLTQFFIYLNQLLWPIAAIGWVTGMIQRGAASMGRLGKILDSIPAVRNSGITNHSIRKLRGKIRFDNVSLSYFPGSNSVVLKEMSFEIPEGGSLGILGAVGSGKSSTVNLIPRLYDATGGVVTIDDHDVGTIPLEVLRRDVAVVPQESFLFSDTLRNNVRFGRPDATDDQVFFAAACAQLDKDIDQMPKGFDTVVGERGITLSGGQKQRTALARAILSAPSILILDDSLSAVDTDTEERILMGLRDVMKERTTIVISHRVSTLKHCDRVIVLHNGAVVEEGTHAELIARGGRYAETYERQLLEQEIS